MEFRPAKLKGVARFRPERWVPYPESLKNVANLHGPNAVVGKYNGSNVVIDDPEMTHVIYNLGCFGKGSLSRGEPNFHLKALADQNKSLESNESGELNKTQEKTADTREYNDSAEQSRKVSVIISKTKEKNENPDTLDYELPNTATLPVVEKQQNLLSVEEKEEFKFQESLHLNLEEAYFLCYGLGCLQVVDLFDKTLSLEEAWILFCESQDDFVQKYVVYHYYRAKGWVVKPGLKFGGDFVIYKWGAHITHASYIVVIEVIRQDGNISEDHQLACTWTKFISLNRMAETAGKEVILCRVVWPQDVLFKDVQSPDDIKKFSVEEILTRRWISSQERELLDKEEIE